MTMQPVITDELVVTLVTGCQHGEPSALEQLYDLYADRLFRYLTARIGDPDTAADLTTEVFLRVIPSIGAFRLNLDKPAATVSAWLYRIAANLAAQHYRAQKRMSWSELDDLHVAATEASDPQDILDKKEERTHLAQALTGLSEDQRLVITGKFVEDMSNAEIAAWLGKTEGSVKSLQHRALRSLARLMRPESSQARR